MTTTNSMAYVQARLQARHGARPDAERWRLLESSAELGAYLEGARRTSLRPWVVQLSPHSDAHSIERSLRWDWRQYTGEVAAWAPAGWRPAIRQMAMVSYLPFIGHLAGGGRVFQWMLEDPLLGPVSLTDPSLRQQALDAAEFSNIAQAITEGVHPVRAWLDSWVALWPDGEPLARSVMQRMGDVFAGETASIIERPSQHARGPALRRNLEARLLRVFRQQSGRIPALFAHLGLVLLDMERLRGGLLLRVFFPDPLERPQWS